MATPDTYVDVFERLERDGARYVVVGGVAVVLHGYERPVADLDIAIDRRPAEAQRAMATLMRIGFVPTLPLPIDMVTVMRMFDASNREIDVLVRYLIPFEELFAASEIARVGSHSVRVASLEHVLQEKRSTRRPQDLQEVETLLSVSRDRFRKSTQPAAAPALHQGSPPATE